MTSGSDKVRTPAISRPISQEAASSWLLLSLCLLLLWFLVGTCSSYRTSIGSSIAQKHFRSELSKKTADLKT